MAHPSDVLLLVEEDISFFGGTGGGLAELFSQVQRGKDLVGNASIARRAALSHGQDEPTIFSGCFVFNLANLGVNFGRRRSITPFKLRLAT